MAPKHVVTKTYQDALACKYKSDVSIAVIERFKLRLHSLMFGNYFVHVSDPSLAILSCGMQMTTSALLVTLSSLHIF
jgi:hypothetical protein